MPASGTSYRRCFKPQNCGAVSRRSAATRSSADDRQIIAILHEVLSSEGPGQRPTRSALLTASWRGCEGGAAAPIDIDILRCKRLLARKCEQLMGQCPAPLCRTHRRGEQALGFRVEIIGASEHQLDAALN